MGRGAGGEDFAFGGLKMNHLVLQFSIVTYHNHTGAMSSELTFYHSLDPKLSYSRSFEHMDLTIAYSCNILENLDMMISNSCRIY